MKFVRGEGVWRLIDEHAPQHACVIATLRNEVEILAMKRLCEHYLADPGHLPEPYGIEHDGRRFIVAPSREQDGKLILNITGEDGAASRLETEFVLR